MKQTKRWNVQNDVENNELVIQEAAHLLKKGCTVAFPTETVYGLGADATSEEAVAKIFQAKGRPQDNPLIAHVATKQQLKRLVSHLPPFVEKMIDSFAPGPITFVLPSNGTCANNVTAGLSTVAVRIPSHPVALKLLKACQIPIAAPSANISGKPSPTTADHVWEDLRGKIAGVLDGGPTGIGMESTVIDCTKTQPIILRPGGITQEQIEQVIGTVMIDPSLTSASEKPLSPGLKYKHYTPDVPLWLVEGSIDQIQAVINSERNNNNRIGLLASAETAKRLDADQVISLGDDLTDVAAHLYDGLRLFKKEDVDLIVSESYPEKGIGQAIMNRLRKAASAHIQDKTL